MCAIVRSVWLVKIVSGVSEKKTEREREREKRRMQTNCILSSSSKVKLKWCTLISLLLDVEEMTVPMFYGNSYLHYVDDAITKRIRGSKMDLHIRFRAFAPEGLLIWSGDQNKTSNNNDFMSVSLEDGLVKYTYNLGSGEVTLTNNYSRVDDGVWHSLRV